MATNTAPAATSEGNLGTLNALLEKYKGQIAIALPRHMTPERMIRIALTAVSQTPMLRKCNPYTVCGAVVQASILGLEPNSTLGEAFLIPYWNKKANNGQGGYDCQLQVGYKGHVKLARNSGEIAMVDAQPVCEGDTFEFEKGDTPYLKHKWAKAGARGAIIGYWAGFKTKDGTFNFEYWALEDIHKHRDLYTKSRDKSGKIYGPWVDNPDWMCRKTVLIQVLKLAPKSVQLATALAVDENPNAAFSIDVPLELQPADEPEQPQIQAPQRASAKNTQSQAQQPSQTAAQDTGEPSLPFEPAGQQSAPEGPRQWKDWEEVATAHEGDKNHPDLGKIQVVEGKTWTRETFEQAWTAVDPTRPTRAKRS
jgi:recombination protein RecT